MLKAMSMTETKRRTLVKTATWRIIGIVWTWVGAYLILLFTPERYRTAAALSTFIVAFHHSTRMLMYYGYERVWTGIDWGKCDERQMQARDIDWTTRLLWTIGVVVALGLIFLLVLCVTPKVKP